jgi:hypothetical protein
MDVLEKKEEGRKVLQAVLEESAIVEETEGLRQRNRGRILQLQKS